LPRSLPAGEVYSIGNKQKKGNRQQGSVGLHKVRATTATLAERGEDFGGAPDKIG